MCGGSLAVGGSNSRSGRASGQRRVRALGCATTTAQCQRHAGAISSEPLESAPADRATHRFGGATPATFVVMPSIPIIMPQLGESIAEATIVHLLVKVGDSVRTDQD